jgi:hypothetical protein
MTTAKGRTHDRSAVRGAVESRRCMLPLLSCSAITTTSLTAPKRTNQTRGPSRATSTGTAGQAKQPVNVDSRR